MCAIADHSSKRYLADSALDSRNLATLLCLESDRIRIVGAGLGRRQCQGNKALMLPGLRSMLAAMVATAILVTPIGIAFIPAPGDSYPRSAGYARVGQPIVPKELVQNVKRQAYARRATELNKLLTLAESAASVAADSSSADSFDGPTSPQVGTPKTHREDAADGGTSAATLASQQLPACADVQRSVIGSEAKIVNARPEPRTTEAAQVEPAIEPTAVMPRAKPAHARLHARRWTRLTRGTNASSSAPPAVAQSNPDPYIAFNGSRRTVSTSAFPVAPPASAGSRGSAF